MTDSTKKKTPLQFRLRSALAKLRGQVFVPDNFVITIYRDEMYYDARGPGFVRVNRFSERTGELVNIGPRFDTYDFTELPTKQGVQLGLRLYLGYAFDPRTTQRDIAKQLVVLKREIISAVFYRIARGALLKILPAFEAEAICRGQVFIDIEKQINDTLPPRLKFVGMTLRGVEVQGVILPQVLRTRFEQVVQRNVNIQANEQHEPTHVAQSLAAEIVEKLSEQSAASQFVSVSETLSPFKSLAEPQPSSAKTIESDAPKKSSTPKRSADKSDSYLNDDTW